MAQIFRPGADTLARVAIAGIAVVPVLAVGLANTRWRSPYATAQDVTREQPVPFSHEHHVGGLGIDCRYCHTSVEKAAFAGIPPTETCMSCHSQIWTNAPMLAPVRTSLAEGRPLVWRRVHALPDYVYFNHAVHVAKGMDYEPYFRGVEDLMNTLEGRPHWGKLNFQTADVLKTRYEKWDAFQAVRNKLDPNRVFQNEYTQRVLGD